MKALWVILAAVVSGALAGTAVVELAILWAWMLGGPDLSRSDVYFFAALAGVVGVAAGFLVGTEVES